MNRRTTEDYLKAIYQIEAEHGVAAPGAVTRRGVSTNDVAERLAVAAPSVTAMLKKLAGEGLVSHTPYQGVELTDTGRTVALEVVRRHRLAERYLQDVLGLSWDQVHDEAEEWEHVLSERVTAAIDKALGRPRTDPHGEPIPSTAGQLPPLSHTSLSELRANDSATIDRVANEDGAFLRYLGGLGLYPAVNVTVVDVAPFEGPVTIAVAGRQAVLGRKAAEQVFVADVHSTVREA